jgi:hypothetical protein
MTSNEKAEAFWMGVVGFIATAIVVAFICGMVKVIYDIGYRDAIKCTQGQKWACQ